MRLAPSSGVDPLAAPIDSGSEAEDCDASGPRARESLEVALDELLAERGAPELPTLRRFAGYELLGRIAVGGMAEVFLARERSEAGAARLVALKVIRAQLECDPEFAEMFMREGAVALGLRHPNICHTYRFGVESGHPFLAMELVTGVTVRELIQRGRRTESRIPAPVAARIASIVAEALHAAHVARDERGRPLQVVHQDVSPHNVMVAWDGTVKLLDFGVAQSSLEQVRAVEASQTAIRGKLAYLSPEQCTGARLDARSDVFALGVVLYEMLTGQRIFKRDQTLATMRAIAAEALPAELFAGVPEPLAQIIRRALQKSPHDRYQSAAAMQEDLERYLVHQRAPVTSAKIAEAIKGLMGDRFGRPPELETNPQVVAWLAAHDRDDPTAQPLPLVREKAPAPRPRGNGRAIAVAFVAMILGALAAAGVSVVARDDRAVAAPVAAPPSVVVEPAGPPIGPAAIPAPPASVEPVAELEATPDARAEAEPVLRSRAGESARERRRAARAARRSGAGRAVPGGFVADPGF